MTKYDPRKHNRQSIRLKGYDYTQPSAYFITIVTHQREHWLGEIVDGNMRLSDIGGIARREWERLPQRFETVELDEFVIMPNHVHGIIVIAGRGTAGGGTGDDLNASRRAPTETREQFGKPVPGSIPTIVRSYKSSVSWRANRMRRAPNTRLWQRNYCERIIRTQRELNAVRRYIRDNPSRWAQDRENRGW